MQVMRSQFRERYAWDHTDIYVRYKKIGRLKNLILNNIV